MTSFDRSVGITYGVTTRFAGWLATPPTVTTTACEPSGALWGIVKSICVTPTNPAGIPVNRVVAVIPPTVTVTGSRGLGNRATGVPENGVAPANNAGNVSPSPVMYSVNACPRPPITEGANEPSGAVKIPGAEGATWNEYEETLPLLLTPNTAVPAPIS